MLNPAKVVDLAQHRESRSPLQVALAAVNRCPDLNEADRDIIRHLAAFATPDGFYDLYRHEQMAITGASKSRLKSALKRATTAGLLHLTDDDALFVLTDVQPGPPDNWPAMRLFYAKTALRQLSITLCDTGTKAQDASWYAERISIWLGQHGAEYRYTEAEIISIVLELKRLRYFRTGVIESDSAGQITIRYEPTSIREFSAMRRNQL